MNISLIAAMAKNRTIGKDNTIPWHIPGEQVRFRELTTGHTLIWGRKTYESIGKPLPRRKNIIVTRNPHYQAPGCKIAPSLQKALDMVDPQEKEVFIGGGEELYRWALPHAQRIYLTVIHKEIEGDTIFPEFSLSLFQEVARKENPSYIYLTYERK